MRIGPDRDPPGFTEHGAQGIFNTAVYAIVSLVGAALGSLRATAVAALNAIEHQTFSEFPNATLDPQTAAIAAVRGVVDEAAAAGDAEAGGISPERFKVLYEAARAAPSNGEMLDAWRRGIINTTSFDSGLFRNGIRDEWVDFYRAFRHIPVSFVEYLQAAVQNHIDHDDAIQKADALGVTGDDAEMIYQTLGDPPGPMQLAELANRQVITDEQFRQGIRESRIKDKYLDAMEALRVYIPPVRTITALLRSAAITEPEARLLYSYNGVQPDVINSYIANATHGKTASHKQASVGEIKSLYSDHLVTRAVAETWLERIGYLPDDANLLLDLADYTAQAKLYSSTITKIRALFVGRHIDEAKTRADLAQLNVDMPQTEALLRLWVLEQQTPTKELTLAQLTSLAKANVIDHPAWLARVEALGYSAADAALLAELDFPTPHP